MERVGVGVELERMDRSCIYALIHDIRWLVGYEARNKYKIMPTFKLNIIELNRELNRRFKAYKQEWGTDLIGGRRAKTR